MTHAISALVSIAACIITLNAISAYCREHPRLSTGLALFAVNWALLVPYYSALRALDGASVPTELMLQLEIIPSIGGFLLIQAATVFSRQARNAPHDAEIKRLDRWAIWLLVLIVSPSLSVLPLSAEWKAALGMVFGTAMTVLGLVAVSRSTAELLASRGARLAKALQVVAWIYAGLEVMFTASELFAVGNHLPFQFSTSFKILFAALKLTFTALVIGAVAGHVRNKSYPSLNRFDLIEAYLRVAPIKTLHDAAERKAQEKVQRESDEAGVRVATVSGEVAGAGMGAGAGNAQGPETVRAEGENAGPETAENAEKSRAG